MSRKKKRPSGRPGGRTDGLASAGVQLEIPPAALEVSPVAMLADLNRQRRELDARIGDSVRAARAGGATWTALAGALGVSPQAVQKRFGSTSTTARQQ